MMRKQFFSFFTVAVLVGFFVPSVSFGWQVGIVNIQKNYASLKKTQKIEVKKILSPADVYVRTVGGALWIKKNTPVEVAYDIVRKEGPVMMFGSPVQVQRQDGQWVALVWGPHLCEEEALCPGIVGGVKKRRVKKKYVRVRKAAVRVEAKAEAKAEIGGLKNQIKELRKAIESLKVPPPASVNVPPPVVEKPVACASPTITVDQMMEVENGYLISTSINPAGTQTYGWVEFDGSRTEAEVVGDYNQPIVKTFYVAKRKEVSQMRVAVQSKCGTAFASVSVPVVHCIGVDTITSTSSSALLALGFAARRYQPYFLAGGVLAGLYRIFFPHHDSDPRCEAAGALLGAVGGYAGGKQIKKPEPQRFVIPGPTGPAPLPANGPPPNSGEPDGPAPFPAN